jgi:acetoin utilization protein AcuB
MSVKAWMATDPVTIRPDTEVRAARALMRDNGVRHLPVVEDGRLVGIVSDRDLRIDDRSLRRLATLERMGEVLGEGLPAEAVMTESVHTVGPDASVGDAARTMLSRRVSAVPVVDDDGTLLGIITTTDCLLAALDDDPILG